MSDDDAAIREVLEYWLGSLSSPTQVDTTKSKLWWAGGAEIDAEIEQRFGALVARARAGELDHWKRTPRGSLALVILLDQFTRNLGRGTPEAFAGDAQALETSLHAIEQGHDAKLYPLERSFLYMPLMHAEDRAMAERSVRQFAELSREIAALKAEGLPDFHSHAVKHAAIVERFGRYPHRNEILGRTSTPEEVEYLDNGGESFGQTKKR